MNLTLPGWMQSTQFRVDYLIILITFLFSRHGVAKQREIVLIEVLESV
jgi:hypothetical protein